MMDIKQDVYGLSLNRLKQVLESMGENPAKAEILFSRLYRERCDISQLTAGMNSITAQKIQKRFFLGKLEILEKQDDGRACKYLFRLSDGHCIESVLLRHPYSSGLCISTQVGCAMGCRFCASGQLKLVRNLTAAEMTEQLLTVEKDANVSIQRIDVMGVGEPFHNYTELSDFLDLITEPKGLNIGPRHITVSTCGIVPQILAFARRGRCNNLAISLHAPENALRSSLMPVNDSYSLEVLLPALREYADHTHQQITIEYVMLRDLNDALSQADQLAALLKDLPCRINLIPYNAAGTPYHASDKESVSQFLHRLKQHGFTVTVRQEYGAELDAACGQLRAQKGILS